MSGYVIKLEGLSSGARTIHSGRWVVEYDPTRGGTDPDGEAWVHLRTTTNPEAYARHFDDIAAAIAYYQQVDPREPVRPDGRPNRPLTAYSVLIEPEPRILTP